MRTEWGFRHGRTRSEPKTQQTKRPKGEDVADWSSPGPPTVASTDQGAGKEAATVRQQVPDDARRYRYVARIAAARECVVEMCCVKAAALLVCCSLSRTCAPAFVGWLVVAVDRQ